MTITIQPLGKPDIPAFTRLELEAFRTHPRIPMLWPQGYTADLYAYYEDRQTHDYQDPQTRLMKAVDSETGEMIAVSQWTFALDPSAEVAKPPADPHEQRPSNWPEGGNWEIKTFFKVEWDRWQRENLGGKPYIELNLLVTHPDHHRRGAGTQLLAWGCEQADRLGVTMCLESTPVGVALYERFGFQAKRVVKADMKRFGWMEPYDEEAARRVWMVRGART